MSRIAPNLSKDQFDVSPIPYYENEAPKTNRQHLRVPISARGIRFGTLSIPKPHNRIIQTWGYAGSAPSAYPLPPSAAIQPAFESSEPWTRASGVQTACPRSGTATRSYFSGDPSSATWPWRGSTLQGSFPNSYYWQDPPDAYSNRPNCAIEFTYRYLNPANGQWTAWNMNTLQGANVPLIRDDVAGVATIGACPASYSWGPWNFWGRNTTRSNLWSALIHRISGSALDINLGPGIGYTGRFWVQTQRDFYGNLENTLETRTYQFLHDLDAPQSGIRQRWAWADSAGGVKELRLMTRLKNVRFSTFVVQTWKRQWIPNGAGGGIPIPNGATATQHRTATTDNIGFAGDTDKNEPYTPWIAGEYPGHPTFNLAAFEAAFTNQDASTVAQMASTWSGSWAYLPTQSQYRWHRFRWQPTAPTWGAAKKRMLGYSERSNALAKFCALGLSARVFTTTASDDHEITYAYDLPVVLEREHTTPTHLGETVRTDKRLLVAPTTFWERQALPDAGNGLEVANFTYHPLSPVPSIDTTEKYDRMKKRVTTRTEAAALNVSAIVSDPLWAWKGFQTRIGTANNVYWTVEARIRLSRVYGPYGQADGALKEYPWGQVPGTIADGHYTYYMMYNNTQPLGSSFPIPVEGWHNNTKPTVTPNPIVLTITNPQTFASATVTVSDTGMVAGSIFSATPRVELFVSSLVTGSSAAFLPKNIRIRIDKTGGVGTSSVTFSVSAQHHEMTQAGSFSFTIRAFDGYEYSDPIPVTVNVLPPPPP